MHHLPIWGILFFAISIAFSANAQKTKAKLDTIYTETVIGFQEGELGDCLGRAELCEPLLMLMYPLQNNIPNLKKLVYKRFYHDSTLTKISREYIRSEDSIFLYAEYAESGRLLHYGALYTDYQPIIYTVIEGVDSLMNKVPKAISAIQPVQLRKIGAWQETLNVGIRAGFYQKDEPVGKWKYFSLSFFGDFDLPSQIWTYKNGAIAERDTLNFVEQRHTDVEVQAELSKTTWFNRWENTNFMLMSSAMPAFPYEAWIFEKNGKLTISAVVSAQTGKAYDGTWRWESPLKVHISVPNFATTTLNLRYLGGSKLLFYK
jgi:hypothetical protein